MPLTQAFNANNIDISTLSPIEAFKLGVLEVSQDPVIFIDPDKIDVDDPQSFITQLEEQVPGSSDAIVSRFSELAGESVSISQVINVFKNKGPAAFSNVDIDGNSHGFVNLPNDNLDSTNELLSLLKKGYSEDVVDNIKSNMKIKDQKLMRHVGNHEGEHLNQESLPLNHTATDELNHEVGADAKAGFLADQRGDNYTSDAFEDFRHLTAHLNHNHATGALLNSGDVASDTHIEMAGKYRKNMDHIVKENFQTDDPRMVPEILLEQDPDSYFHALRAGLSKRMGEIMDDYKANPDSPEVMATIEEFQVGSDYINNFEGAYRRRVLGQDDFPQARPTQLITQEIKNEVAKQSEIEEAKQVLSSSEAEGVAYTGDTDLLQDVADSGVDVSSDLLVADNQVSANVNQVNNMSLSV